MKSAVQTPLADDLAVILNSTYTVLHSICAIKDCNMKTNITLKIDADLAQAAKVLAARRGTSLSRLVADQLAEAVRKDSDYEAAKRRALAQMAKAKNLGWQRPKDRGDVYDR